MARGTGCKSLYDICNKSGSIPEERRATLDVVDDREAFAQFGGDATLGPNEPYDCRPHCQVQAL